MSISSMVWAQTKKSNVNTFSSCHGLLLYFKSFSTNLSTEARYNFFFFFIMFLCRFMFLSSRQLNEWDQHDQHNLCCHRVLGVCVYNFFFQVLTRSICSLIDETHNLPLRVLHSLQRHATNMSCHAFQAESAVYLGGDRGNWEHQVGSAAVSHCDVDSLLLLCLERSEVYRKGIFEELDHP